MDAGYELPLPAAQITERLNVRERIPLSAWSLRVTEVRLVPRPERVPLVELTVEIGEYHSSAMVPGPGGMQRWSVRFVLDGRSLQPGALAAPLLLLLRVRLEDWWLNRARYPQADAQRLDTDSVS